MAIKTSLRPKRLKIFKNHLVDDELVCRDFCTADPVLWFLQAESVFRDLRITESSTKFCLILQKLPQDIICSVYSLIRGSAALTTPYEDLRDKLVSPYTHTHKSSFLLWDACRAQATAAAKAAASTAAASHAAAAASCSDPLEQSDTPPPAAITQHRHV